MEHSTLVPFERRFHSQNGEDGVIAEILVRIGGPRARWFVEFGAGRGQEGNCVLLADELDWSGLFMEAGEADSAALESKYRASDRVITTRAAVTADNVEELLLGAGVPADLDLLSIDIDGNDYWVWHAIESFRPRVVVIEYNGNLPLDARLVMPRDDAHQWDGTDYFGASLGAYRSLGAEKGYELVHTDSTGVNAFFVVRDALGDLPTGDAVPLHPANYGGAGVGLPRDPRDRPFLDLDTGRPTPRAAGA